MTIHPFFIDNLYSDEIIIPWSIQSELTIYDLVYVAIKQQTSSIYISKSIVSILDKNL